MVEPFRRCFDYSGRSGRREYWVFGLAAFVVVAAVEWIEAKMGWSRVGPRKLEMGILGSVVMFTFLIPGLALSVRRLHDSNRAGWWLTLPGAPVLLWAVALVSGFSAPDMFTPVLVAILVSPLIILALMCVPGTRGPNRFGPDPKAEHLADIFS
jgi:uncharacterized membrane protein YhaH (DUF805 family)